MERNKFLLKLAMENKLAHVSDDGISVANVSNTSTSPCSEKSQTSTPEKIYRKPLSELQSRENIIIHSNLLLNTSQQILPAKGELATFNVDKSDFQEEVLGCLLTTLNFSNEQSEDDIGYTFLPNTTNQENFLKDFNISQSILSTETELVPFSDKTYFQEAVPGFLTTPETSPKFGNDETLMYVKSSELRDSNVIIQENASICNSKSPYIHVTEQPGNDIDHNISQNTTVPEVFEASSDKPNSDEPEAYSKSVPRDRVLPIQAYIQDSNVRDSNNILKKNGSPEPPIPKSDSILTTDIYAFVETDSEKYETRLENSVEFPSSGSEYIPSDDSEDSEDSEDLYNSTRSTSNIEQLFSNKPEIFQAMEVKKTYTQRNPIGQPVEASDKIPVANKDAGVQGILDLRDNQVSEQVNQNLIFREESNIIPDIKNKYLKKPSARERPTLCPFCYQDVVTHFPRHLFRHHKDHKDVKLIQSLKAGSSERQALISALRKQGYFHLNTEKNVVNPVRSSKDPNTEYFVCTFCLGHYNKKLLYKHVKICKNKPADLKNPGRNCLSRSQTFMASAMSKNQEFLRTSRLKKEVFNIMRADNISEIAKNDPLICLYGESLLAKHKRQQIANVVSNKVREMARMLIAIKSMDNEINSFFDVLRPEMFGTLLSAAKIISGYDEQTKSFKAPSLALHMGTNLKVICNVAFKIVMEKRKLPKINWENRDKTKSDLKDIRKLIEGHWCNEISSLALKTLKERQWEQTVKLPLTGDILLFQTFIHDQANKAYENLIHQKEVINNYKILAECVLAHTVMFNRKRVGDVQYLKIATYKRENESNDQEAFTESLTTTEKILSKKFKRVVTDGKGSKPVPILFSPRIQKYITRLLNIRENFDVVPNSNPYLFANPNSQHRWMAGTKIIRCLANNCGAKEPKLLTSTKFRKHIATTLQLMTMESDEMEQIAKFMGHTKKTHAEFYRLPQDIYQTAKVAKVLLLLEKGRGKEFRGKRLNEIELNEDVYYSSESEEDSMIGNTRNEKLTKEKKRKSQVSDNETSYEELEETAQNIKLPVNRRCLRKMSHRSSNEQPLEEITDLNEEGKKDEQSKKMEISGNKRNLAKEDQEKEEQLNKILENETDEEKQGKKIKLSKSKQLLKKIPENETNEEKLRPIQGRVRWTIKEKELVRKYFDAHVKDKVTPRKYECDEFLKKHGKFLQNKDWVKIKTFVYNCFRQV